MALYEAIEQEEYLRELADRWKKGAAGLMAGLGRENPFQAARRFASRMFQSFKTFKSFKSSKSAPLVSDLFEQPESRVFTLC